MSLGQAVGSGVPPGARCRRVPARARRATALIPCQVYMSSSSGTRPGTRRGTGSGSAAVGPVRYTRGTSPCSSGRCRPGPRCGRPSAPSRRRPGRCRAAGRRPGGRRPPEPARSAGGRRGRRARARGRRRRRARDPRTAGTAGGPGGLADAVGQIRGGVEVGGVLGRELVSADQSNVDAAARNCRTKFRRGHANTVRGRSCTRGWSVSEGRCPRLAGPEGPVSARSSPARSRPATRRPTPSPARATSRSPSPRPGRRRASSRQHEHQSARSSAAPSDGRTSHRGPILCFVNPRTEDGWAGRRIVAAARSANERPVRRHPGRPHPDRQYRRDRGRARQRRAASGPGGHRAGRRCRHHGREGVRDRGPGAAGRGHARRRAPGRRGDRRWYGLGSHAADRTGTVRVGRSIPAHRRRGRGYGPRPGGRDAVPRRGQTGAEPHAVSPSTRHAMGGRGARG